jgi:hypothetical protein
MQNFSPLLVNYYIPGAVVVFVLATGLVLLAVMLLLALISRLGGR